MSKYFWVPEAPNYPGVYAPVAYQPGVNTMTLNIHEAIHFDEKERCEEWCRNNPKPVFEPREHAWFDEPAD